MRLGETLGDFVHMPAMRADSGDKTYDLTQTSFFATRLQVARFPPTVAFEFSELHVPPILAFCAAALLVGLDVTGKVQLLIQVLNFASNSATVIPNVVLNAAT